MTIATRVVGMRLVATGVAHIHVAAEHSSAAGEKCAHHLRLCAAQPLEASLPRERAQEVGNLQCRPRHLERECFALQAIEWTGCGLQSLRRHVRVDRSRPDAVVTQ